MKISLNLYGRVDGLKFLCFPSFPENSLQCVILCYTVYITPSCKQKNVHEKSNKYLCIFNIILLNCSVIRETILNYIFCWIKKVHILFYFFSCILHDYMLHDIIKEFWKNSHFENMTAGFLLRCKNWGFLTPSPPLSCFFTI